MIQPLALHDIHAAAGATFAVAAGFEIVDNYGDPAAEHARLWKHAGLLDLSYRSRLCVTGADRARFLHGQVTNDIQRLRTGDGCYTAIVNGKGKMESDANVWRLPDEMLLDFEPGLATSIAQRLEKYIVADDVQVQDVGPYYGLISVQGPEAERVIRVTGIFGEAVPGTLKFSQCADGATGDLYLMNQPRTGTTGYDCFIPLAAMKTVAEALLAASKAAGGGWCGWQALEAARIEAGIPRFGMDMDAGNLPLECIGDRAVSYNKGCYIGQEVLNRVHTVGHVNRELRGLRLADDLRALPVKGDKLIHAEKEAGFITSALASVRFKSKIAMGYVRRECNQIGSELTLRTADGESVAKVVALPLE